MDVHVHGAVDRSRVLALRSLRLLEEVSDDPGPLSRGLHPWDIDPVRLEADLAMLEGLLDDPRILALGECGIDRLRGPAVEIQTTAFLRQTEISRRRRLPLLVHCVRAGSDLLAAHVRAPAHPPWILHGWTGGALQTGDLLRHDGILFSFSPSALRPGARARESMQLVPPERLFLETDDSGEDAEAFESRVSTVLGVTPSELRSQLHRNWERVFAA